MRHEFREQECTVFRKHTLIEDQEELASVRSQALYRMREAGREVPQVALAHVVDKDRPIRIQQRDASISVEHDGPLIGCMPMEFAKAASSQAHIDARQVCGGRQFALRHLMGPAALLNSLFRQIEGVPNGTAIPKLRRRRRACVGIIGQKWLILLCNGTRGIVAFRLLRTFLRVSVATSTADRSRSKSS